MIQSNMYRPDKARIYDTVMCNGIDINARNHAHPIIGEVEVIKGSDVDGKTLFTKTIHQNDLLVNGAVYISEKINNMRSTFKPSPLDVEVGTHTIEQVTRDNTTIGNETVCGLIIGTGGTSDTYNTVRAVKRGARMVPGMVPYRVVPLAEDINGTVRSQYFMRVIRGDYVYYYGKSFEIDKEINVQFDDGTPVPMDVENSETNKFIKTFTKYKVTVDQADVREYFKLTEGSTKKSRVNSVGLVAGYPVLVNGNTEYFNVRCLTTLNMENQELKDSESTITFIYRLYIL